MEQLFTILQALGKLLADPLTGGLALMLVIAALSDFRSYRIPNWLTLSGVIYGLVCNALMHSSLFGGLMFALQGALLCFAITLPMYAMKGMGAGDVKLITMVGAFLGIQAGVASVICMFMAGGAMALAFMLARGLVGQLCLNLSGKLQSAFASTGLRLMPLLPPVARVSIGKLPFGISIGLGTMGFLVYRQLGLL